MCDRPTIGHDVSFSEHLHTALCSLRRGEGECGEERESVWVCIVRKEDGFWGRDACLSKVSCQHDQMVTQINQPKQRRYCNKGNRNESSL